MAEDIKKEEVVEEVAIEEVVDAIEEEVLPEFVVVGGKKYMLNKTGAEQARQVSDLLNWLGDYGQNLASVLVLDETEDATENILGSTWGLITSIGRVASQEALIDLFVVVIGCSKNVANKHFSINTLVDGIQVLLAQEEYAKVINRFF